MALEFVTSCVATVANRNVQLAVVRSVASVDVELVHLVEHMLSLSPSARPPLRHVLGQLTSWLDRPCQLMERVAERLAVDQCVRDEVEMEFSSYTSFGGNDGFDYVQAPSDQGDFQPALKKARSDE